MIPTQKPEWTQVEHSPDDKVLHFEMACCEGCTPTGFCTAYLEEGAEYASKWLCVGRYAPPENPKNDHERYNCIRRCLLMDDGMVHVQEWTPHEALSVARSLLTAIAQQLREDQPKKGVEFQITYEEEKEI